MGALEENDKGGRFLVKSLCFKAGEGGRRVLAATMGLVGKERIPLGWIRPSISLSLSRSQTQLKPREKRRWERRRGDREMIRCGGSV